MICLLVYVVISCCTKQRRTLISWTFIVKTFCYEDKLIIAQTVQYQLLLWSCNTFSVSNEEPLTGIEHELTKLAVHPEIKSKLTSDICGCLIPKYTSKSFPQNCCTDTVTSFLPKTLELEFEMTQNDQLNELKGSCPHQDQMQMNLSVNKWSFFMLAPQYSVSRLLINSLCYTRRLRTGSSRWLPKAVVNQTIFC